VQRIGLSNERQLTWIDNPSHREFFVGLHPAKNELAEALAHLETWAVLFMGRVVDPAITG
jgi:hypothetical protein